MATFSATISQSSDDALQDGTSVSLTGTTPTVNATNRYLGLRWLNVTIPPGSTINTASITFSIPSAANDDPDLDIWGHDTDDAPTFTTTNNDISSRTPTTATVTWTATGIGTGLKTSPDLAAIFQEIIDRPGWASGNDIAVICKGRSSNSFRTDAFDGSTGNYPTVNIDYTTPSGGTTMPIFAHYYRQLANA